MRGWIIGLAAAIAVLFLAGGRIHFDAAASKAFDKIWTFQKQDAVVPAFYDYIARYIPGLNKKAVPAQKKLPGPGPNLRPRSADPVASPASSAIPIYGGAVNEMYSKESMEKWKDESIQQMNQGRNPFVEAAKKKQDGS